MIIHFVILLIKECIILDRHAYLILAHQNYKQLSILLELIDDSRNDIYIHIDKRSVFTRVDKARLYNSVKESSIYFSKRTSVSWGGYSVVVAEINLLEAAINNGGYCYYHLLSGQDLPIKTQDYIHSFFKKHSGFEFISFCDDNWISDMKYRVKYYWFFQEYVGRNSGIDKYCLKKLDKLGYMIQSKIKVDRLKDYSFSAGSQWFSVTDEFARYLLSNKKNICKMLKATLCCDESLCQIFSSNSNFKSKIYQNGNVSSNMRLIDWSRGSPYVFRIYDYDMIIKSDCLFARKFDMSVDENVIYSIRKTLLFN